MTSPYSAEYGRSPGAAVSVTTKSGTNEIHGTVYDFYRNDEHRHERLLLGARRARPSPPNDQNQFGGNLGGPIVKDKAFFFVDYEGTRITRGVTRITSVPTADERARRLHDAVRDPLTGQPFPGNTHPREPHRSLRRRHHGPRAAAEPGRAPTTSSARPTSSTTPTASWPASTSAPQPERHRLRPLHLLEPRPPHPGRLRRHRRRHRAPRPSATRRSRPTALVGGLDAHLLADGRERVPLLLVAGRLRRGAAAVRRAAAAGGARRPRLDHDPIVAGGIPASPSTATSAAPAWAASARPTSCPSSSTRTSSSSSTRCPGCAADHAFKFGVDVIAPMKNEYMDVPATRGALRFRNRFTGNPMADYLLGYVVRLPALERLRGRPAALGHDRSSSRTTGR